MKYKRKQTKQMGKPNPVVGMQRKRSFLRKKKDLSK